MHTRPDSYSVEERTEAAWGFCLQGKLQEACEDGERLMSQANIVVDGSAEKADAARKLFEMCNHATTFKKGSATSHAQANEDRSLNETTQHTAPSN